MRHQPRFNPAFALACLAVAALPIAACHDDEPGSPPGVINPETADGGDAGLADTATVETGSDAGDEAGADAGVEAGAPDTAAALTTIAPIGIAILNSDHKSTSISLAPLAGTALAKEACLDSGSRSPNLSAFLSGDVVLASAPQPRNELAVIDRFNGTITWVAPATCEVLRQLNVGTGFASNPQDLVGGLPGGKAYVTRFSANPGSPAEGSDVLVIDPDLGSVRGRIDLRPATPASSPPGSPLLPLPTRAALAGGKVYIVLNDLSADFKASGVGRLVVIDPATDAVTGTIDLPGLKNCGALQAVAKPGGGVGLVVGCNGVFADPQPIDAAGIAWIDLATTPATVTILASAGFLRPVSGFDVGALSPALGFTVVAGGFGMPPNDAVWSFDLTAAGSAPKKLYDADSSFSLSLTVDAARRQLYILDAAKTNPRVHVFTLPETGAAAEIAAYASSPTSGLPPRQLVLY